MSVARVKGVGTINKDVHQKANSKLEYKLWKSVIKDCLLEATTEILEKQRGYDLPIELGKIIILQAAPHKHINRLFSATKNGGECSEMFNFHSFGDVGSFNWKNQPKHNLLRMWKYKPNRQTLKVPLYHIFHAGLANYIRKEDFNKQEY